jgi:hypothetical protein
MIKFIILALSVTALHAQQDGKSDDAGLGKLIDDVLSPAARSDDVPKVSHVFFTFQYIEIKY